MTDGNDRFEGFPNWAGFDFSATLHCKTRRSIGIIEPGRLACRSQLFALHLRATFRNIRWRVREAIRVLFTGEGPYDPWEIHEEDC